VLETSIKEEPVDFEEIEKVVANVAHALAVNFTCEICNKSFSGYCHWMVCMLSSPYDFS
jgi:hypothetical protein